MLLYSYCGGSVVTMPGFFSKDLPPVVPINADLLPEKSLTLCPTFESYRALPRKHYKATHLSITVIISHFLEEWCKNSGECRQGWRCPPPSTCHQEPSLADFTCCGVSNAKQWWNPGFHDANALTNSLPGTQRYHWLHTHTTSALGLC